MHSGRNAVKKVSLKPAQVVVLGFAFLILLGAALLMLPFSWQERPPTWVEALFTATSATCLTGLSVVDTATFWTPVGQVIIMLLIQIGGFGVMVFATMLGLIVSRKLSVRSRLNTANEAKLVGFEDVRGLVRNIVKITLAIEAIVFVVLVLRFTLGYGYSIGEAAWRALFHSVSAFNNAGFSTYSDGLVGFVSDPWVLLPIAFAVIVGGIGFPVIVQLRKELTKPLLWTMNTKLVLWGTAILLVGGTAFITIVEWNNPLTLGELNLWDRILSGFFQAVQTRTSGFNSIDIGAMREESWFGMDVMMLIGGGPAGTAGGIKITTFGVLLFIVITELRGEGAVNIFGKRLARSVHRQATTVVLLAVACIVASTMAIMQTSDFGLSEVLFEVVSAFGTVGLSTGITADLHPFAQMVLVALMFVGRLGPMTLGTAIALRTRPVLYEFPKERPVIG